VDGVGDDKNDTFHVRHNLDTTDVIVQVWSAKLKANRV
jgi:hypothetical protein